MRQPNRRELLRRTGGLALGVALGGCRTPRGGPVAPLRPEALDPTPAIPPESELELEPEPAVADPPALLRVPDLSDARVLRFTAGLRPYRAGGVRLELERLGDRTLVHDYGHGGAGITLAWGCADEVLALVLSRHAPPEPVAVLGAGVSGLSCAHRLAGRGFRVRVLAREFTPETTSDKAGGQWAPSMVERERSAEGRARFERWLRGAHAAYAALADGAGEEYGVFRRPNYATRGAGGGLRDIPLGLFAPPEQLERLPFPGRDRPGERFQTFLIEPYRFLPALMRDLERSGVAFERAEFAGLDDLHALPERILVNTLGLGAGAVFDDDALVPVRGQLVLLEPQELPYLLSHQGYLFPRSDALVLGGTVERGATGTEPSPARCRTILAAHRRFFAG
jgi:glycine/D-amino acid oxidase-like deaminating enzyme